MSLFHAAGLLAVILVAAKTMTLDRPSSFAELPLHLLRMLMASWSDALFALVCGALGEGLVRTVGKDGRAATMIRRGFLTIFALFAIYAVAAIGLYHYFLRPITAQVLGLIGNAGAVRSSILARMSWPIAISLLIAPAAFLALVLLTKAKPRLNRALALGLVVWIGAGSILHQRLWKSDSGTVWLSPHFELLRTTALTMAGRRPAFSENPPANYFDEFRSFAARGTAGRADFFQLPAGVARPRNVIVVILESVGTRYLGLYGISSMRCRS